MKRFGVIALTFISAALAWGLTAGQTTGLEAFAALVSAAGVVLATRENVWNWLLAIIGSILYGFVFWTAELFSDAGLQGVFVLTSVFGWFWWVRGGTNARTLPVSRLTLRLALVLTVLTVPATWFWMRYLIRIHDTSPFWDALTTILSLAAQFLLSRKVLENWHVWFVADAIYVYIYIVRGLYPTAVLYALFLPLCVAGIAQWRRTARK